MSPAGRKALVACAVIDGHTVPCDEEVRPRLRAIERARELGVDPAPLIRKTEQIVAVHLQEVKGHGQIGPTHQRRQR